tara:strand:- start:21486 stop:23240 length:1755 start_codon:yes stop_codon:yes gene_type:complete
MLEIIKEGFLIIKIPRKWYFLFFLLTILISFFEILGIGFVFVFLDTLLNQNSNLRYLETFFLKYFQINDKNKILIFFTVFTIFCFLLRNILLIIFEISSAKIITYLQSKYCTEIFSNYLNKEYKWYIENDITQLIINVSQHITMVVQNVVIGFFNFLSSIFIFLSISLTVIIIRPFESLSIITFLLILMFTYFFLVKNLVEKNGAFATKTYEDFFLNVSDPIKSIRLVKTFGLESFFLKRQKLFYDKFLKHNLIINISKLFPKYIFELIVIIGILFLVLFYLLNNYNLVNYVPTFAFFAVACLRLLPHIGGMLNYMQGVKRFQKALFQLSKSIKGNEVNNEKIKLDKFLFKTIELKNINFSYPDGSKILKNLNLKINKGDKIAIVGKSGSGKTTLLNLILGLLKPTNGKLYLNNIDSSELNFTNIFSLLPQESFILTDTLEKNISLSEDKYNMSDILEVMKITNIDYFYNQKSDKLINRFSSNFSEGEKQRIGLARVFYSKKQILVFDEPTSSLDSINEKKIMKKINSLHQDVTVILVTHKLNTLKDFNKIVFLNDKNIEAVGNFNFLYKNNKKFKIMTDYQNL